MIIMNFKKKYQQFNNFPMEIDDDEINEIEEFEKDTGNRIFINVYGMHKDIKKQCEDSFVGEYMNSVDESRRINNIGQHDRLSITEDDYDKYTSQCIQQKQ